MLQPQNASRFELGQISVEATILLAASARCLPPS
jgi:hypothetical protein